MNDYLYEIDLRPRFIDLWKKHHFRSDTLAKIAEVDEETILALFRGEAVEEDVAISVLAALSRLVEEEYTLDTVRINLRTKGKNICISSN